MPPELPRSIKSGLAIAAVLCIPATLMAADLGVREGVQWAPYLDWTLDNPQWSGNPFDVVATVEFIHDPSGETRRTEMFFVGETTWAFRFTATQLGSWSFTTISDDADLNAHTGRVEVVANPHENAHGFLKNINGKWGWDGTETVFVPQLVMWDYIAGESDSPPFVREPEQIDRLIEEFIVNHGFDGFHVAVVAGRWFDVEAESDAVDSSTEDPDPRTFDALERLITKTHAAGGMVHIWPWGDESRSQTPHSLTGRINGEIDTRLQRYIAARLGPVPGWSMGYGFDLDEWVTADEVRAWRDAMHELMGWHHFLGGRPEGPNSGTDHAVNAAWNEGLDYSSYEHHRPTYEVYLAAVQARPGQPVMSEDRFRIRESQYAEKDYSEELTRRGLYDSTMAGGVANIWGISPDLSPGGVFPNRDQIRTYADFFHRHGRFLADMSPAFGFSSDANTRVLFSAATQSLVVYCESTDTVDVDLSSLPGPLPAVAVDTMQPYAEIDLGELSAELDSISLPYASDWVIAVGDFE